MKTALRLPRIAVLVTALSFATAALAQPPPPGPPGAPGAPGDPRLQKKRRHGIAIRVVPPGPGPRGFRPPLVPPPPPPPPRYSHYSSRTYRVTRSSDSTLSSVQGALKTRGYYTGSVDGVSGPATRGAITGFRGDNGLGTSTGIDSSLLRALGL